MYKRAIVYLLLLCAGAQTAQARFPFSFSKPTLKTDYSQTVWDQMMQEQALLDMRRGMGEMSQARYQEATNSFAKAVIKNTKDPMGYLLLGASLYWAGKVDEAISEYKEALTLDSKLPMAYQLLGIAAGWKGDIETAQDYFLTANRLDPNKADTHMNLGSTYAAQNKLETALEHFRQAVDFAPREPLYHYQLGMLYEALGRDEQAEASLKKALHYFSAYEDAQLALGALYEKMNRPEQALKFYKKALKTKPGDYVARLRYALLLVRQGQTAKARSVLEEAFSIVRFKEDGLALNAVYSASGHRAEDFSAQINAFAKRVAQVPPSKPVQLEVALNYESQVIPSGKSPAKNSFERAYEQLRSTQLQNTPAARAFKRTFTLPETDRATRAKQIENLISALQEAVRQTPENMQVQLSMQGHTADFNAPGALTRQNATVPKAVYDPRIVGNDMGLWVMGKTWLKFVDEAEDELAELACPAADTSCALLSGLAALARGGNGAADFARAAAQDPQDPLAVLGQGTAAVVAGDEASARAYYEQVLKIAPDNKTAKRNLQVLD